MLPITTGKQVSSSYHYEGLIKISEVNSFMTVILYLLLMIFTVGPETTF